MLDIAAAIEGFKSGTIPDNGFVRSSNIVLDGLTKNISQAMLHQFIANGTLDLQL